MNLRHLFRSRELITLINRMGHCEGYDFSLELETAIANALQQTSSLLSNQIFREPNVPSLFHSDFDNFDEYVSELKGAGSIHTAHGIMMQELKCDAGEHGGSVMEMPAMLRTTQRSMQLGETIDLPDCYITQRIGPGYKIRQLTAPGSEEAMAKSCKIHRMWIVICRLSDASEHEIPGLAGFISLTGMCLFNIL